MFLFLPRVCTVTEDQTNRKRRPFTSFCFRFWKFLFCSWVLSVVSVPRQGSRARNPAIAHCKRAWEFGGIATSAASPMATMPSCPPIAGDICRRRWLSQARRLVPGLPLPQARHSREITPPDRCWLNARRPASDSMPAGPPLTQCPPDRRWLKPAGSPLTHARRIAADSCPPDCRWLKPTGSALTHARWPPLTLAPWIESTCHGQECRVFVLLCPREHFKLTLSSLVHGDSSGAGGSSCCGHGGHSSRLPPCRGYGGGRWGTLCGPLTPGHAQMKPQPPSQPRRASGSCGLSCPVCLAWRRPVLFALSCLFSPGGLLIPPHFPREILGGGSKSSGCRGRAERTEAKAPEDHLPWPPELPTPPWPPELPAPPWPPELPAPPWLPELPAPPWSLSVCSTLEVPVLCSCPYLSWGASRAPTPPSRWNC